MIPILSALSAPAIACVVRGIVVVPYCILCMVDTLRGDYLGERCDVQSKQHRSKYGSLSHTIFTIEGGRLFLTHSNRLLAMCHIRTDPVQGRTRDAKCESETTQHCRNIQMLTTGPIAVTWSLILCLLQGKHHSASTVTRFQCCVNACMPIGIC